MLISAHGIRLNVLDGGAGDPTLLFLHGNGGDVTNWAPQLDHFGGSHRVVAIDLRGFGRSDRTLGDLTLRDYAEDVAAVLGVLDVGPCIVIGLSLGGMVALELALAHPHLVLGLLLADTAGGVDEQMRGLLENAARLVLELGLGPTAEAYLPALFAPATLDRGDACVSTFMTQFASGDPYQHYLANRAARDLDLLPRLPEINVPAVVVCGEHDQVLPPVLSEQLHGRLPSSRLTIIPDAAHVSNLEQPEMFNAELELLIKEVDGRSA